MGELMREQSSSFCVVRVLPFPKYDIVPHGVCARVQRTSRRSRTRARMHAYLAEVMAETSFHECKCRSLNSSAGRGEDLAHSGRSLGRCNDPVRRAASQLKLRPTERLALAGSHDLVGYTIRFLFMRITRHVDGKSRL